MARRGTAPCTGRFRGIHLVGTEATCAERQHAVILLISVKRLTRPSPQHYKSVMLHAGAGIFPLLLDWIPVVCMGSWVGRGVLVCNSVEGSFRYE